MICNSQENYTNQKEEKTMKTILKVIPIIGLLLALTIGGIPSLVGADQGDASDHNNVDGSS